MPVSLLITQVTSMDTDIILLSAAKKMDEESLIRIFDLYATPIYGYALRLCDDPLKADEIVGAVFARFMDQISSGHRPVTHLRICLYKIAYEIIVADAHLDCWTGPAGPVQTTLSAQSIGSSRPANSESRELLEAVLRVVKYDLTEDQRHVLFLRFLEGFTLKETAAIIGKKVGNVKVIQHRAFAALSKTLEYHGIDSADLPLERSDLLVSTFAGSKREYRSRPLPN